MVGWLRMLTANTSGRWEGRLSSEIMILFIRFNNVKLYYGREILNLANRLWDDKKDKYFFCKDLPNYN